MQDFQGYREGKSTAKPGRHQRRKEQRRQPGKQQAELWSAAGGSVPQFRNFRYCPTKSQPTSFE
jgi:hypothetical protein